MGAAAAAIHHEQALGPKSATLHQRLHAFSQLAVLQRLELVEQRRDHAWVEHHHQQGKRHPDAPGPEPPQAAGALHQPQVKCGQRQADDGSHQRAFEHIGPPQALCALVETEAFFQTEGGVPAHRQFQRPVDQEEGGDQRQLLPEGMFDQVVDLVVERSQATQQRPADHDGGAVGALPQVHLVACHGVGRGFLVRLLADVGGKGCRYLMPVPGHMANLA